MRSAALWFRIAAVLLLLFAAGHTAGFLLFVPPTAEGRAVSAAMVTTRFSDAHGTYSYGDFYRGFGLWITASQVFAAFVAWRLAAMARRGNREARPIGWALCALQAIGLVLSLRYFSLPPVAFSLLVALCLGLGAWRSGPGSELRGA